MINELPTKNDLKIEEVIKKRKKLEEEEKRKKLEKEKKRKKLEKEMLEEMKKTAEALDKIRKIEEKLEQGLELQTESEKKPKPIEEENLNNALDSRPEVSEEEVEDDKEDKTEYTPIEIGNDQLLKPEDNLLIEEEAENTTEEPLNDLDEYTISQSVPQANISTEPIRGSKDIETEPNFSNAGSQNDLSEQEFEQGRDKTMDRVIQEEEATPEQSKPSGRAPVSEGVSSREIANDSFLEENSDLIELTEGDSDSAVKDDPDFLSGDKIVGDDGELLEDIYKIDESDRNNAYRNQPQPQVKVKVEQAKIKDERVSEQNEKADFDRDFDEDDIKREKIKNKNEFSGDTIDAGFRNKKRSDKNILHSEASASPNQVEEKGEANLRSQEIVNERSVGEDVSSPDRVLPESRENNAIENNIVKPEKKDVLKGNLRERPKKSQEKKVKENTPDEDSYSGTVAPSIKGKSLEEKALEEKISKIEPVSGRTETSFAPKRNNSNTILSPLIKWILFLLPFIILLLILYFCYLNEIKADCRCNEIREVVDTGWERLKVFF
ncbi:MAG: hypothetical protein Kow0081_4660 [Candidatus Dojkabacteria bacterium]